MRDRRRDAEDSRATSSLSCGEVTAELSAPDAPLADGEVAVAFAAMASEAIKSLACCGVESAVGADGGRDITIRLGEFDCGDGDDAGAPMLSVSVAPDGCKVRAALSGTGAGNPWGDAGGALARDLGGAMRHGVNDLVLKGDGVTIVEDVLDALGWGRRRGR